MQRYNSLLLEVGEYMISPSRMIYLLNTAGHQFVLYSDFSRPSPDRVDHTMNENHPLTSVFLCAQQYHPQTTP